MILLIELSHDMNTDWVMKYHIVPFGCQMNKSDTERIRTVLSGMGYTEAFKEDDDDIVLRGIVACSVRQKAIDRVYGKIHKWNKTKDTKSLITFLSGCVLPADKKKFLKLFDLVFSIDQLPALPEMIRQYGVTTQSGIPGGSQRIEEFWNVKPSYSSRIEAYVPIQNGCNKFCSFCAVPYTRGREVSRPSEDILSEVQSLVAGNCKSITLLGQNVNSYGLDRPNAELTFPQLMRGIGELGQQGNRDFWVFFTSPHPRDMTRELLEVMARYPVLARWIHLPLQSGDDEVLRKMNRKHTMEQYRTVVKDIRRILPDSTLFTDIIVGFTDENEEQFQATANAMREFQYDMAYIARYSMRPGAKSADWEDNVSPEEKLRRFHILSSLLIDIAEPVRKARVGKVFRVLVTEKDRKPGFYSGYTEGRIPVRVNAEGVATGEFAQVKITGARPLSMEGVVVREETL